MLDRAEIARAREDTLITERQVPGIEDTARLRAEARAAGSGEVVVVGRSMEDREETLSGVLGSFAVGGPIAVLAASLLGYLLAAGALRPVEAMRRRASEVSFAGPGERLPLPAARDEVRRLGETLNEMLERLRGSYERERRFVADASHELRTPLAVLKTELEATLRTPGLGADARESLGVALSETDQLAQLADDLLLIARAGDGGLPLRREPVDVRELLEHADQRFEARARSEGRAISVDAPAGLSASLDPLRMRQALGNLVDNALRHGSGTVVLAARPAGDGPALEIAVSDEGPGFPDDLTDHAFERFTRGDSARTRGGAGLGLAIVSAIAEAHGGSAAIDGAGGLGSTVRLHLPG